MKTKTPIPEPKPSREYLNAPSHRERPENAPSAKSPKERLLKQKEQTGTPGEGHRVLAALAGDWNAEVKCWLDPAASPEVSRATSRAEWILNGHFLKEEFRGEMLGRPFTGECLLGYDNSSQKYNCIWLDDTSTAMFISEGTGDQHAIILEGNADSPATGAKDVPMKQVFHIHGPEKHVLEMFHAGRKAMEITYTKR